jgi:translation elongation factor EF-4
MLHMDVFKQRLSDEFNVEIIITNPSVPYKGMLIFYNICIYVCVCLLNHASE